MRRLRRCGRLATRQERRKVKRNVCFCLLGKELMVLFVGSSVASSRRVGPKDMPSVHRHWYLVLPETVASYPPLILFCTRHQTNNLRINSVRTIAGKGLYTHSPVRHHAGLQRSRPLAPCAGLNTGASCVSRAYCRTFWRSAHHPAARGRVVVHAPRPV